MQPLWKNYVNITNYSLIRELVYKGIVDLQPSGHTQVHSAHSAIKVGHLPAMTPPSSFTHPISINKDNAENMTGAERRPRKQEISIRELQTKTTPTCLSSL